MFTPLELTRIGLIRKWSIDYKSLKTCRHCHPWLAGQLIIFFHEISWINPAITNLLEKASQTAPLGEIWHGRIQRGGCGSGPPVESHKAIGFLRNTSSNPLENYKASIQCRADCDPLCSPGKGFLCTTGTEPCQYQLNIKLLKSLWFGLSNGWFLDRYHDPLYLLCKGFLSTTGTADPSQY